MGTESAASHLFREALEVFSEHHPEESTEGLQKAFSVADEAHRGQLRKSGDAFITHPVVVCGILASYGMDASTLTAAILHDTVEDTDVTIHDIESEFGEAVAWLIDGVTKLERVAFRDKASHQAATIRKMMVAMARDVRVLLIKLADRLHNVRTLDALPDEKQVRIARETLDVYAPLAHRLGVQEIKHEMEDRCFPILYPRRHAEILSLLDTRAPHRDAYIADVIGRVEALLSKDAIEADVAGRPKHPYSIYRKMVNTGLSFDEIHDLIGIRIVTGSERDCYGALGAIHAEWPPIQGRFKDYVAQRKFNLYQSLHTTVVGPDGKPLEVQIRTRDMHQRAEYGVAAHWRYKEQVDADDLPWMSDIRFLQETYSDPDEFLEGLKIDLYQDEVFVITPKGDVVTLPLGATPIDFAYKIHTEVGHRCVGARVNGRLVPLSTRLESGDIVDVSTSRSEGAAPSRDWLGFVKTSRAAAKIRQWFTKERRQAAFADGRESVTRGLRKEGLGLGASEREAILSRVADDLGYGDSAAMLVAVGESHLASSTVVGRVVRVVRPEDEDEDQDLLVPPARDRRGPRRLDRGVIVEGLEDLYVRIARCCAPVPGDPIVGFVTVGRGVSVHRADCTNIAALESRAERLIDVAWDPSQHGSFSVWIQVEALDRTRLLQDVTHAIGDIGANILASSSATGRDRVAVLRFEVELADNETLHRLLHEVRNVDAVFDAFRLLPQHD